jgi:hypothetical protein
MKADATGDVPIRRGALFLANIGGPIVAGVIAGNLQPVLTAAVLGMLFSFADNDGTYPRRLALLLIDATAMATAGVSAICPPKRLPFTGRSWWR